MFIPPSSGAGREDRREQQGCGFSRNVGWLREQEKWCVSFQFQCWSRKWWTTDEFLFLGTSVRETEAELEDFAEQKVRLPLAFRKAVRSREGERERENRDPLVRKHPHGCRRLVEKNLSEG